MSTMNRVTWLSGIKKYDLKAGEEVPNTFVVREAAGERKDLENNPVTVVLMKLGIATKSWCR